MIKKGYIFYIAIIAGLVYLLIAQIMDDSILPFSVYYYFAFASLGLSILELLKTTISYSKLLEVKLVYKKKKEQLMIEKLLLLNSYCGGVVSDEEMKNWSQIDNELSRWKSEKRIRRLDMVYTVCAVVQVSILFIQLFSAMIKKIPYTVEANKMIGILTILSFMMIIVSFLLSQVEDNTMMEPQNELDCFGEFADACIKMIQKTANNRT